MDIITIYERVDLTVAQRAEGGLLLLLLCRSGAALLLAFAAGLGGFPYARGGSFPVTHCFFVLLLLLLLIIIIIIIIIVVDCLRGGAGVVMFDEIGMKSACK